MNLPQRFVIIDGNAILHRAYHALPPLTTSSGELVNAVFGFCSMILRIRDELRPSFFAVTFDLPKPTFRKKLYANYQIKRPKMDVELSGQIEKVKEVVRTMEIPIYEKEGFEADDVIGTLVSQVSKLAARQDQKNIETIIVTGDRDLLQLVDERTKVYMLMRGLTETTLFDGAKVEGKYGLKPMQIPDYKGLIGDESDNYPGVNGIGPKTAVELLQQYQTFKGIYQNLAKIPYKTREKLASDKENGEMSFQLATIIKNVPVKLNLEKCKMDDLVKPEVIKIFEELEFNSLIRRLRGPSFAKASPSARASRDKSAGKEEEKSRQMGLF